MLGRIWYWVTGNPRYMLDYWHERADDYRKNWLDAIDGWGDDLEITRLVESMLKERYAIDGVELRYQAMKELEAKYGRKRPWKQVGREAGQADAPFFANASESD